MITDSIVADAKSSGAISAQGKLLDCPFCTMKKGIIQNHGVAKIAKPNGKIIAFMTYHHDQDLNLRALGYSFECFLHKNDLPDKYYFIKIDGHWVAELTNQGYLTY